MQIVHMVFPQFYSFSCLILNRNYIFSLCHFLTCGLQKTPVVVKETFEMLLGYEHFHWSITRSSRWRISIDQLMILSLFDGKYNNHIYAESVTFVKIWIYINCSDYPSCNRFKMAASVSQEPIRIWKRTINYLQEMCIIWFIYLKGQSFTIVLN